MVFFGFTKELGNIDCVSSQSKKDRENIRVDLFIEFSTLPYSTPITNISQE
jgi:hypothetical protein